MFYQEKPYFTGDKIKVLKPKISGFNKNNAQFFLVVMRKPFELFSWGTSSYNVDVIKGQKLVLPVKDGDIDFDFMESFIAELEAQRIAELSAYLKVSGFDNCELSNEELKALQKFNKLSSDDWGTYTVGNLFERVATKKLPYKAKELPKQPTNDYVLPCLTSSFQNQGLNYYAPKEGATVINNVISLPSNSDVYRAYYQSRDFTVLSDSYAIRWKLAENKPTPNQYLFMVMCINKVTDLPIYSYLIMRNMLEQLIEFLYVKKNPYLVDEYLGLKIDLNALQQKHTPVEGERRFGKERYVDNRLSIAKMTENIGERNTTNGALSLYDVYCILSEKCHNSYFDPLLKDFNAASFNVPIVGLNDEQITLLYAMVAIVLAEY